MPELLVALHQAVHVLLNVVSILNTFLLAIDALFGASQARRSRTSGDATNGTARG